MSTNKELAQDILDHIGGEENIRDARHCMTRLRFHLDDTSKADTDYLKNHEEIIAVVENNGQYQVVIGNHVEDVYSELEEITKGSYEGEAGAEESRNLFDQLIDVISGIFQPFLYPLAAAGMIKGIVAIMGVSGVSDTNGTYVLLNALGDGFFQFLPFMIGVTAARKFKMNQFTALGIIALFLYPTIMNIAELPVLYTLFEGSIIESQITAEFLGIPIIFPEAGYHSTVMPIILTVFFAAKVENFVKNYIPSVIRSALTPFLTFLIAAPISFLVIGPVSVWLTDLIAAGFTALNDFSPVLFGVVLGGAWQVLVMFGLHWGLAPFMIIVQLAEYGTSTVGAVINAIAFAQFGAILAILLRTDDNKLKNIGIPAAFSSLFGITEPAIYGVTLPMRKPFIISLIAGAVQGAFIGLMDISYYVLGGMGIFSIPSYIDVTGQQPMNVWLYVITILMTIAISFVLTYFFGVSKEPVVATGDETTLDETEQEKLAQKAEKNEADHFDELVNSPLEGKVLPLSEVNDPMFSGEMMGQGLAIQPSKGEVVAPFEASITTLFPTGHAVGLTTDTGLELLIHIGLDTVELEGEHFTTLVEEGERVTVGQPLIQFDVSAIQKAGYETTTPVVVTNTNEFADIIMNKETTVEQGQYLLTALKNEGE